MKFFTDKTVENDYLLIKIKDFIKMRENNPTKLKQYKEILIDPGVYDLKKSDKFSWEGQINIDKFINILNNNQYISIDYPCDMNLKYQQLFIQKTYENIEKYRNNKHYIITVQSKFYDFDSFKENFDKCIKINSKSNFLAIGNICRINQLNYFIIRVIIYCLKNIGNKRLHFYGLNFRAIKFLYRQAKYYRIPYNQISFDSTKWTRAVDNNLKQMNNGKVGCLKNTRQLFFDYYKDKLNSEIKKI